MHRPRSPFTTLPAASAALLPSEYRADSDVEQDVLCIELSTTSQPAGVAAVRSSTSTTRILW